MPRLAVPILFVLLLIGLLVFLSTRVHQVPTHTVEVDVSQAPNAH